MGEKTIKQPMLFLRSGYFIDSLRATTGQSMAALERRIRAHQYEAKGLKPPSEETVRDYFRLYRTVAFEPHRKKDQVAPWLLAAELEIPGMAFAFFHPLFDILFGHLESDFFWSAEFEQIPEKWILDVEARGDLKIAEEWRAMNAAAAAAKRKHRKREFVQPDPLSIIHLSMMRLPEPIGSKLFERKGLATTWSRCYSVCIEDAVSFLLPLLSLDALCALVLLAKEGAEIGDIQRFNCAKEGVFQILPKVQDFAGCKRIGKLLRRLLEHELENNVFPRRYSRSLSFVFGLPVTWQVMASHALLDYRMDRLCKDLDQPDS